MDITQFYNISSGAIKEADAAYRPTRQVGGDSSFSSFLQSAVNQINETNSYIHDQEEEEIKLALGLTDNTHDLAIAQSKAAAALQITKAFRDRFIEAYREIMQMQI